MHAVPIFSSVGIAQHPVSSHLAPTNPRATQLHQKLMIPTFERGPPSADPLTLLSIALPALVQADESTIRFSFIIMHLPYITHSRALLLRTSSSPSSFPLTLTFPYTQLGLTPRDFKSCVFS